MSIVVTEFVRETLGLMGFAWLTASDSSGINHMTRVFAYTFDEENLKLSVVVYKTDATNLIACFEKTKKVAVAIGDPLSFKTIQMKGDYLSHRDANADDVHLVENVFRLSQNNTMRQWGMPDNVLDIWRIKPAQVVDISVHEIYDQTPRQNTGNKIS